MTTYTQTDVLNQNQVVAAARQAKAVANKANNDAQAAVTAAQDQLAIINAAIQEQDAAAAMAAAQTNG